MNQFSVTVFSGKAYRVEKHNALRNEAFNVPEGSLLLYSEPVVDREDVVVGLEVWVAVPQDAVIDSEPTTVIGPPSSVMSLPAAETVPVPFEDNLPPTREEIISPDQIDEYEANDDYHY